jgi:c-di-GMP-binding flagellar brake protein YcgR
MDNRKFAVGLECRNLLQEAVQKHLPLTLTNKQNNCWQVYKSTFIGVLANRLVVALPVADAGAGHIEPSAGQEVAITFKKGYHKCLFVTRIVGREQFELDPGVSMPAMTVFCPQQIEKIQRRSYNRATVPAGEEVVVSFWPSDTTDQSGSCWQAYLVDLSAGGMGLKMGKTQLPALVEGQQVDLEFVPLPDQEPLRLQGRFRHATDAPEAGQSLLGFQLVGLEMSEEGRQILRRIGRIASLYQRQEPLSKHSDLARK